MTEDEYDAWCWDNRKFFNEWWLDFAEYEKHLPKSSYENDSVEEISNTLVQNRPVHYESSHLRKIMNFSINYEDGIFQTFSFPVFKGVQDERILLTLLNDGEIAFECEMTRIYDNQFQIGIFSEDIKSFCFLLHLLQYSRDFDVSIRGNEWEIRTFIKGSLSQNDVSCSLKKMVAYVQNVMTDSFQRLCEAHKSIGSDIFRNINKKTKFASEITNFILQKSGISREKVNDENFYKYSSNHKNEYTEFMRELYIEDVRQQTSELYRFSVENIVIAFSALFDYEIVYLSKMLWNYFLGEEFDFNEIANVMNSLVARNHDFDDVEDFLNSESIYDNI